MSDELDPSARDFLASALEDAQRLDDGARRRMRDNVLGAVGAGAGVVAIATAVKGAPRAAKQLQERISGARTVEIGPSGHALMAEAPDATLDALIDFLS